MENKRPIRIIIVGDSYVNRLLNYMDGQQLTRWGIIEEDFCLTNESLNLTYIGRPGGDFKELRELTLVETIREKTDIVVFMAGGNDLDKGQADPIKLASDILEFAKDLQHSELADFASLTQVLERPSPKYSSRVSYAEKADIFNESLQNLANSHENILYWSHCRLNQSRNYFTEDGVHLNEVGNYSLYFSIKKALAHAIGHHNRGEKCRCPSATQDTRRPRGGYNGKKRQVI